VPLVVIISVLRSLGIVHKIFVNSIADKLIILNSDNKSEDGDNDLHTGPASCIFDSGQPSYGIFNLETLYILSNRIVSERDNDHSISNNKTMLIAKR
jgi:hypothetical protein